MVSSMQLARYTAAASIDHVTDLEMAWASPKFHCLAEGSSMITVSTTENSIFRVWDVETARVLLKGIVANQDAEFWC